MSLKQLFITILTLLFASVLYLNNLDNRLIAEDEKLLVDITEQTTRTNSTGSIKKAPNFTSQLKAEILKKSFTFTNKIKGENQFKQHALNLTLHFIASALLFILINSLFSSYTAAFYSAAIFAVTPFNSEAINLISARPYILSAICTVLSLLFFNIFRKSDKKLYLPIAIFFMIGAFVFNISALPLLLLAYDLMFFVKTKSDRKKVRFILPHLLTFTITAIFYATDITKLTEGHNITNSITASIRILSINTWQTIAPIYLNINHSIHPLQLPLTQLLLTSLLPLALIVSVFSTKNAFSKIYKFAVCWFFITTIPLLFNPFFKTDFLYREHYGYLSGMAISILFGSIALNIQQKYKPTYAMALFASLFLFFSYLTVQRNTLWNAEEKLWLDALAKSPVGHTTFLATSKKDINDGKIENAEEKLLKAININPNSSEAFYLLGITSEKKGNFDKATTFYGRATGLNPNHYMAHNRIGKILLRDKLFTQAASEFSDAIAIDYYNPEAHLNMAEIYHKRKQLHKLEIEYKILSKIDPDNPELAFRLGNYAKNRGMEKKALTLFRKANKFRPNHSKTLFQLAIIYQKQENYGKAIETYKSVLTIDPGDYSSYNNLGLIYEKQKKLTKAVEVYKKAIKINSKSHVAHNNLGIVYLSLGNYKDSLNHFQYSTQLAPDYIDARYNLANIYALVNDKGAAWREYRKVLLIASKDTTQFKSYIKKTKEDLIKFKILNIK